MPEEISELRIDVVIGDPIENPVKNSIGFESYRFVKSKRKVRTLWPLTGVQSTNFACRYLKQ